MSGANLLQCCCGGGGGEPWQDQPLCGTSPLTETDTIISPITPVTSITFPSLMMAGWPMTSWSRYYSPAPVDQTKTVYSTLMVNPAYQPWRLRDNHWCWGTMVPIVGWPPPPPWTPDYWGILADNGSVAYDGVGGGWTFAALRNWQWGLDRWVYWYQVLLRAWITLTGPRITHVWNPSIPGVVAVTGAGGSLPTDTFAGYNYTETSDQARILDYATYEYAHYLDYRWVARGGSVTGGWELRDLLLNQFDYDRYDWAGKGTEDAAGKAFLCPSNLVDQYRTQPGGFMFDIPIGYEPDEHSWHPTYQSMNDGLIYPLYPEYDPAWNPAEPWKPYDWVWRCVREEKIEAGNPYGLGV